MDRQFHNEDDKTNDDDDDQEGWRDKQGRGIRMRRKSCGPLTILN